MDRADIYLVATGGGQMTEGQESQTEAAWAAVDQARRGITVAWFSTFVNLAVVAVALFAPQIQSRVEKQKDDARFATAKSALVKAAKDNLDQESLQSVREFISDRNEIYKRVTVDEELNFLVPALDKLYTQSAERARDFRTRFARYTSDYAFDEGVDIIAYGYEMVSGNYWRLKTSLTSGPLTDEQANLFREQVRGDAEEALAEIALLVELNTDRAGNVKPGPVQVGDCEREEFKAKCALLAKGLSL